jgi:mannose-6-phosphate isomerase
MAVRPCRRERRSQHRVYGAHPGTEERVIDGSRSRSSGGVVAPLHLTPVLVPKPWGGRRLERLGRTLPSGELIGESWDVADLDPAVADVVEDPTTRVAAGAYRGRSLSELITDAREDLLGASDDVRGRFPLLVKVLDAREHLSVQVHPPASYVVEHPEAHLKTESWVVLDADPGAELMIGLVDGATLDDVRATVGSPEVVQLLRRVRAEIGDVHHLPAGTIHALGAGILVAEVQTPSDTTFRLYDWSREYGRASRQLHVEAGLRAIELGWEHNVAPFSSPGSEATLLVDTSEYRLLRHRLEAGGHVPARPGRVRILQVISGVLDDDDLTWPLGAGSSVVLPAAWRGELKTSEGCTVLEAIA